MSSPRDSRRLGTLALVLVEDDDPALAAGLGGHHRRLRAGDELAGVGGMVGPDRDPDREGHRPGGIELGERDPLGDPLGERACDREVTRAHDDRELLAAGSADVVVLAYHRAELGGKLGQDLVSDRVPVDVVDPLEVVEVEHQERDGPVLGRGADDLVAEPLVEGPVVPEPGQRIGLGLELEARPRVRVVERERRSVAEPDGEHELLLGELPQPCAVDVERSLDPATGDQRHRDQRLGIGRRALDERDARVEVGAVREHRLAGGRRPSP